jgi:hypothetical protein
MADTKVVYRPVASIGFGAGLTLLFIALKLTGQIDWSWAWVLAPMWFPIFFVVTSAVAVALVVSFFKLISRWRG